jgi:hypothetical protein
MVSRGHDERCPEQQRQPSDPIALDAKKWVSIRLNRNYVRVSPIFTDAPLTACSFRLLRENRLPTPDNTGEIQAHTQPVMSLSGSAPWSKPVGADHRQSGVHHAIPPIAKKATQRIVLLL